MSDYISGGISFTGLGSGTDFDAMITQLKTVESIPLKRQQLWKADWQKRYDAFDELLTQISGLKTKLGGMDTVAELLTKTVASSNTSVATATASGTAPDGTQSIDVSRLASNAVLTNTKVFSSKNTVVTDGSDAAMQYFDYTYKGTTRSVKVPKGTTLQGLVDQINKDAEVGGMKVSASLIKSGSGYVFQFQGNETGTESDLSIASTTTVPGFGPEKALLSADRYSGAAAILGSDKLEFEHNGRVYTIDPKSDTRRRSSSFSAESLGNSTVEFTYDGTTYKFDKYLRQELSGQYTSGRYGIGAFSENAGSVLIDKPIAFKYTDANGDEQTYTYDPNNGTKDIDTLIADITTQTGGMITARTLNGSTGYSLELSDAQGYAVLPVGSVISVDYTDTDGNPKTYTYDPAAPGAGGVKNLDEIAKEINELSGGSVKASISGNSGSGYGLLLEDADGNNLAPATQPVSFDYSYRDADGNVQTFSYSYDPAVDGTKTLAEIADEINEQSDGKIKASLSGNAAQGFSLDLQGTGTEGSTDDAGNPLGFANSSGFEVQETASLDTIVAAVNKNSATTGLSASKVKLEDGTFVLELKGDADKLAAMTGPTSFVKADKVMSEVVDEINAIKGDDGQPLFKAQMVKWNDAEGGYSLELKTLSSQDTTITSGKFNAVGGNADWTKREAQDAVFTMNGLPQEYTSSTNELKEVFPGLTVTLTDTGKANLTVTTNTSGLKEKVVEFVDAVNELLVKFRELTKVDQDKEVDSLEGTYDAGDGTGAASLYNSLYSSQMGSILTGNYGVQLLNTQLKTTLTDRAKGFTPQDADGVGDVFASLSSIGIVMDSDEGSATFGQLKILERRTSEDASSGNLDTSSPYTSLDEALEKDPLAVAELLAGSGGSTGSADIRFESSLSGVTKSGTYDVKYTVNSDGSVGDVYIGGTKAIAAENGQYTVLDSGSPANGITISLTNLEPGEHSSTVTIKQGKISELVDFLDYQTRNDPASIQGGKRGALMVLKDNYKSIMEGIDVKIEREQKRIDTWETRMRAQFARLDTLLGNYQNISDKNASALETAITFS